MAAAVSERPIPKRASGLRLVGGTRGGGGVVTYGGRGFRPNRLPDVDVQALCKVFGGLESEMGLGSNLGIQQEMLAAAPKATCGHHASEGDLEGVRTPRVKKRSRIAEIQAIVMGVDGPAGTEFIRESQNVLTLGPKLVESHGKHGRFLECGACHRKGVCSECGGCRHCGSIAWQTMHVVGNGRVPFNAGTVLDLEAWACAHWKTRKNPEGRAASNTYRVTRDALLRLVELEQIDKLKPEISGRVAVIVLSRMYGAEASTEHSRRWPRLGDVIPLATMTEEIQNRALEMTKRLRREHRAKSFQVAPFEALEAAMSAENAGASALEIRRQAERILERASAAYARVKRAGGMKKGRSRDHER